MIGFMTEAAAIVAECIFVSRFLIKYFFYKSEKLKLVKSSILFFSLTVIDFIGSFVIKNEIVLMIGFFFCRSNFCNYIFKGIFFRKDCDIRSIIHIILFC